MSTPTPDTVLAGSCACGAVEYASTSLPTGEVIACHCKTCRKLSGNPYMVFVSLKSADFKWIGESPPKELHLSDFATRGLCPKCGSHLYYQYNSHPENISILIGTVDEESVKGQLPKISKHFFVGEKMNWDHITDDAPQFSTF